MKTIMPKHDNIDTLNEAETGWIDNRAQGKVILPFIVLLLLFAAGCDPPVQCHTGSQGWCVPDSTTPSCPACARPSAKAVCCSLDMQESCCQAGTHYQPLALSQLPKPDTSISNLDGIVDFGSTTLMAKMDGDSLNTNLKGRVALVTGQCPPAVVVLLGTECFDVLLVDLRSGQDSFKTANGHTYSNFTVRNANSWTGYIFRGGTIAMNDGAKLAWEATIDNQVNSGVIDLASPVSLGGTIDYNAIRHTPDANRATNRISMTGNFAGEHVQMALLSITIWADDCTPSVYVSAQCHRAGVDPLRELVLSSQPHQMNNLQNRDLCNAMYKVNWPCSSCISNSIATFTCQDTKLPAALALQSQDLTFLWRDAFGTEIGDTQNVEFNELGGHTMPYFPVTLTVTNEWGKSVSSTIRTEPSGPDCPPSAPLLPKEWVLEWILRSQPYTPTDP